MPRKTLALAAGLVVVTLGFALPAALAHPSTTALKGTVGPGFTISLAKGGARVRSLKAGSYRISVTDRATVHDFHLLGPGVDTVVTSVPFTGTRTVTVTLRRGTYTYQCDPHAAGGMKGTFRVTAASATAPTTTSDDTTTEATTQTTTGDDSRYGY